MEKNNSSSRWDRFLDFMDSSAAFFTFLAATLLASVRRLSSTSTTTGTDTPTTPEPLDPDETPFHDIGRIDLTQICPGGNSRRVRISGQRVRDFDHRDECVACNHTAQPVVKRTVKPTVKPAEKHGRRSPLDGKESGDWKMPRVVGSAIILYHGDGMTICRLSNAIGLGARSISRVLGGGAPTPCPTSSSSTALAA